MNASKNTFSKIWWHGMHLGLTLLLPLLLVSMIGCIKAKEEKEDLGPEVDPAQIDRALSKAVHGASVDNTAIGQSLDFSVIRRLETEETAITLGATRVEVIDCHRANVTPRQACQPGDLNMTFTLRITVSTRKQDNTFEVKQTEENLEVRKPAIADVLTAKGVAEKAYLESKAVNANAEKPERVTFHRLKEGTDTINPPNAVMNKSNCGGLSPCQLNVRYLKFDLVQWYNEKDYQKLSLAFAFSIDTPFLPFGQDFDQLTGALITDCRGTHVPVDGRTIYVRDCFNLENFQK